MGELEKYGLLSAALLLLMAGLLAFFGRDSDVDPGAHALSANNEVVDRDAGRNSSMRDPGSGPRVPAPTVTTPPANGNPPRNPIDNENAAGGDDLGPRNPNPQGADDAEKAPRDGSPKTTEPPPAEVPTPESDAPVHYAVKKGDTLSSIAAAHFGDKKYYPLIQQANPDVDPRKLAVGQELILPAKSAIHAPANGANPKVKDAKAAKAATGKAVEAVKPLKSGTTPAKEAALAAADRPTTPAKADPKADDAPRKAKKDGDKSTDSGAKKGPREHRVVKGDTLTSIARKYYDDANKWKTIFEANRDKLKSTSIVPEGVVLKIP